MKQIGEILKLAGIMIFVFELTVGMMFFRSEAYGILVHLGLICGSIFIFSIGFRISQKKTKQ